MVYFLKTIFPILHNAITFFVEQGHCKICTVTCILFKYINYDKAIIITISQYYNIITNAYDSFITITIELLKCFLKKVQISFSIKDLKGLFFKYLKVLLLMNLFIKVPKGLLFNDLKDLLVKDLKGLLVKDYTIPKM